MAIRREHAFDPSRYLLREDVTITSTGLSVRHKWAKNHQRSTHTDSIPLPTLTESPLCPREAFERMTTHRPASTGHAPLFMFPSGAPLTLPYLLTAWHAALRAAGLHHCRYTLHSLRRGAAVAIQPYMPEEQDIRIFGRWRSGAYQKYIKDRAGNRAASAFKVLSKMNG